MDHQASQHNACFSISTPQFILESTWEDLVPEHTHILGMPTQGCVAPPASVAPLLDHTSASKFEMFLLKIKKKKQLGTNVHCFPRAAPL